MTDRLHPMTPHHLPFYIAKPGEADVLMIVMGVFLVLAVLGVGNLYLRLHSLPERMAHKSQKLQFERECQWQREQLPEAIRALVLDDQRLRNDICWSVFDC